MNDLDWNLPRILQVVGEEGSLSRAAARLGSSQPTVGRQIAEMEAALGVALLVRSPRGVVLTEAGRSAAASASRMAEEVTRLRRVLAHPDLAVGGAVRVGASEMVGCYVLPPILAELRRRHPRLSVDLVLDDRPSDVLTGDVDVAVRMFRPTQVDLVARRAGSIPFGIFATAEWVARRGPVSSLDDLLDGGLIGFDRDPWLAAAYARADPRLTRDRFAVRTDHALFPVAAAVAGLGAAVLQRGVAAQHPTLVRLLPELALPELPVWVVTHPDLKDAGGPRAAFDALVEGLNRYVDEGGRG